MTGSAKHRSAKALLILISAGCSLGCVAFAQTPAAQTPGNVPKAAPDGVSDNKAGAYYNFAMGRVYAELAQAAGNKPDYITKAIQHYQEALKLDPSAGIIFEELTDLYIQTNHLKDAIAQAEDLLKQNADNLDARRMLARIYFRMIPTNTQDGRINEDYLKKAIEQYEKITVKEPKDAESWVVLGRLYRASSKSPEAENAFKQALKAEPDNEDALTSLGMMYSDLGDSQRAVEMLKSASDKSPNEHTLATLAQFYEQIHDYKNAAEALRKAVELAPDNVRLQKGLAEDLLQSDQMDEALAVYQQLSTDEPRDPALKLRISTIYRFKRDFTKAREALNQAKALDAESLEVKDEEVKLLEGEGKTPQAIAVLKGLVDQTAKKTYSVPESTNRALLMEELGVLYRSSGKYPEAVEAFRQAASLNAPAAPRYSAHVVETYRAAKDMESARREADAAFKKYPKDRTVLLTHANLLADMGKVDEATAEVKAGAGDQNDFQTQLTVAQLYEKGKRWADMGKALDQMEKLAASNEEKFTVHFSRGAMYERMKKFDGAEAEFRKALEISPDSANALNYLGYMLADRGVKLEEASQMIKKALDQEPDNGAYLDSMGWVYYQLGKLNEAEAMLIRAVERTGDDATVQEHLGDVYFKLGKTKEAISQWQLSAKGFQAGTQADADPEDLAKVNKKLDAARVRLAKETGKQ
jgi:tetratricopeptide (TPR) repeat protein